MRSNQRQLKDGRIITLKVFKKYTVWTGRKFVRVLVNAEDYANFVDVPVRLDFKDGEISTAQTYEKALEMLELETI